MSEHADQATVLCPTRYEAVQLERAGIGSVATIICTGPGAEGIVSWAERAGLKTGRVILAGLAGSLRETYAPGEAFVGGTVIAPTGRSYRAGEVDGVDVRRAVIASTESIVTTPESKRILAEKTGADLVDLESGVFAEAATTLGWRWTIVRGVSDGALDHLPQDIDRWIDSDGRVRGGRVAWGLVRRPWNVARVRRLARSSREAMESVANVIRRIVEQDAATVSRDA